MNTQNQISCHYITYLKIKSELSGKKWDAAMKGLAKHGLTKVVVEGENKVVVLG